MSTQTDFFLDPETVYQISMRKITEFHRRTGFRPERIYLGQQVYASLRGHTIAQVCFNDATRIAMPGTPEQYAGCWLYVVEDHPNHIGVGL